MPDRASPHYALLGLIAEKLDGAPLLSFRPSAIVSGSAYLLSPPFGMECLTSLADDMAHYALC
jgi:hypothetical protein